MSKSKSAVLLLPWPEGVKVEVEFAGHLKPLNLEARPRLNFKLRAMSGSVPEDATIVVSGEDRERCSTIAQCLRGAGFRNARAECE